LGAVLFLAVQTVLDDVQIEVGHVHHAEVVHRVGDHQELIVVVRLGALLHQGVQAGDGPAVQFLHLRGRRQLVGVKAVQIAQAVPGGVAELEVVLAELLEDLV
ncbi:GNAT family acetyltransferase, partial [Dysosmobacter welbionis]